MFTFIPETRSFAENENAKIIKTISLEDGINTTTLLEDQMLIEYRAPNGSMEIYKTATETGTTFDVGIGWKTVTTGTLYRIVKIEK